MVDTASSPAFEAVIGLEVHVQLRTRTKLFCACENRFGGLPNTRICPWCLGLPGALPRLNRRAVALALRAAAALGSEIQEESRFDRKNYFYPDQPKNYQVTQYGRPYALGGRLALEATGVDHRFVDLERIQIEEDAGKLVHDDDGTTLVDLNRSGVPLLELVGKPVLRSPEDAHACLRSLRRLVRHLGISDGNMEQGSLRCDANISIRRAGSAGSSAPESAARVEVKNLNSFRAVKRALAHEFRRQVACVTGPDGRVVQETRLFDAARGETRPLRSKEQAHDYRYFPEPDLPPMVVTPDEVRAVRDALPELPAERFQRWQSAYGLPDRSALALLEDPTLSWYFDEVAAIVGDGREAAGWVLGDVLRHRKESADPTVFAVSPDRLADLIALKQRGRLHVAQAREVFSAMADTNTDAETVMQERGLVPLLDPAELEARVRDAITAFPGIRDAIRSGKPQARDAIIGHVMRATQGRADPRRVRDLLDRML